MPPNETKHTVRIYNYVIQITRIRYRTYLKSRKSWAFLRCFAILLSPIRGTVKQRNADSAIITMDVTIILQVFDRTDVQTDGLQFCTKGISAMSCTPTLSVYNSCLKLLLIAKAYIELLGLRQIQLVSKN